MRRPKATCFFVNKLRLSEAWRAEFLLVSQGGFIDWTPQEIIAHPEVRRQPASERHAARVLAIHLVPEDTCAERTDYGAAI